MSVRIRRSALRTCALAVLAAILPVAAQAQPTTFQFDIPAENLSTALRAFARITGEQVAFDGAATNGKESAALHGDYTPSEALAILLQGTDLHVDVSKSGVLMVRSKNVDAAFKEGGAPETVIVTADKREQRQLDVPISITTVTGKEIAATQSFSMADYLRSVPGVAYSDDGNNTFSTIVIRGLQTTLAFNNGLSTTATYFDEANTTNAEGELGLLADIKAIDLDRVEVLRGPQGTAFGASSLGGTLRLIPAAPKLDNFEASIEGGYSNTAIYGGDNENIHGVVNVPIIPGTLAIRVVGYASYDTGWYRNNAGSDPAFRNAVVIPDGAQAYAIDQNHVGDASVSGGRISLLYQINNDGRLTLSYITQTEGHDGLGLETYHGGTPYIGAAEAVSRLDGHSPHGFGSGIHDSFIQIASSKFEYDLGFADLLATYSYVHGGSVFSGTNALLTLPPGNSYDNYGNGKNTEHQGEIRFVSEFSGPWHVLTGIYYEQSHNDFLANYDWTGEPAKDPYTSNGPSLGHFFNTQTLIEHAAYGEVTWDVWKGLSLTGGGRVFSYSRSSETNDFGPFFTPPANTVGKSGQTGAIFRMNASYKFDEDAMVYAGWSQGFRVGSPETPPAPAACGISSINDIIPGTNITPASLTSIHSDSVNNYEIGAKAAGLAGGWLALDGDVYRMDWTGLPVIVGFNAAGACSGTLNAGKARSIGTELQATAQLSDSISLYFSGSYTHADIVKDDALAGFYRGEMLPAPAIRLAFGGSYSFSLSNFPSEVRIDGVFGSPYHSQFPPNPFDKTQAFTTFDLAWRTEFGKSFVNLFGKNIFENKSIIVTTFGTNYIRQRPRTIGVEVGTTL